MPHYIDETTTEIDPKLTGVQTWLDKEKRRHYQLSDKQAVAGLPTLSLSGSNL